MPALYAMTVEAARAADLAAILAEAGEPEPVARIVDTSINGPGGPLPVRIYLPESDGPRPVLLYFFGGGWTLGGIETSDGVCRILTNLVGCATVCVGYRLAPEHKFPAAVQDCHAAVQWVRGHAVEFGADGERLAVAGDSAGGNLAAAVTLMARADGETPLRAQVLVYPNTDYHADTPSMRESDDPALFNRTSVAWYWSHYLDRPQDGSNPLASPLRAADLGGLPPALVITAERDPLRDEGEAYAERLARAGVPVELRRFDGMTHGFFTKSGTLEVSRRALAAAAEHLRVAFA